MILTCPSCRARYLVGADKVGPTGRQVRCGKCRHIWYQAPAEEPPIRLEPLPRTAAAAGEGASADAEPARGPTLTAAGELRPIPRGSNLPALAEQRRERAPVLGWLLLVLVLAALAYGSYLERARITALWPPAARLYELLGLRTKPVGAGLEIRGVTTERSDDNGTEVLLIAGEVANVSHQSLEVPPLAAVLKDARRRNVQHWTFEAGERKLLPGEVTKFSTSLKNPASEATDVDVEFLGAGSG